MNSYFYVGLELFLCFCFFFNDTATTEIYTLSLHDALPTSSRRPRPASRAPPAWCPPPSRSEEHTSELQSRRDLVCRLLLEKKKKKTPQSLHELQKKLTNDQHEHILIS